MAYSFFTGTDPELYLGSEVFSSKINAAYGDYGLSQAQAAEYAVLNSIWRSAYLAAINPQTRTKSRIRAKDDARAAVCARAADLAKIISGTASVTSQQKLDLGLNVRAAPSPMPPPGTPNAFRVELLADGSIELRWKCKHPGRAAGAIYHIYRNDAASGKFQFLGSSGKRRFTDQTLLAGSTGVTYQVQAVRSTAVGQPAQFNVNFGVTRITRAAPAPSVEPATPKLAA